MRKHALLVAVTRYPALPEVPVPAAAAELEALATALLDPRGGDFAAVRTLLDPDRQALVQAIDELCTARHRGELILIYLAALAVLDRRDQPVLLPANAPSLANPEAGLGLAALATRLALSDAAVKVLLLDCTCGAAEPLPPGSAALRISALGAPDRVVWAATAHTRFSYRDGVPTAVGPPLPFAAALAAGLRDAAEQGERLTLGGWEAAVRARLPDAAPETWYGDTGTVGRLERLPVVMGDDGLPAQTADAASGRANRTINRRFPVPVASRNHRPRRTGVGRRERRRRWLLRLGWALIALVWVGALAGLLVLHDGSVGGAGATLVRGGALLTADLGRPLGLSAPPLTWRDPLRDGGLGPPLRRLPSGDFVMGAPEGEPERQAAEGPQRRVDIKAFAIGVGEVSFDEYDRFALATGRSLPPADGQGRGERPVINVSFEDALAYTEWLTAQTGRRYRLPAEAEWEYAARTGRSTPFNTGACIHTDLANYNGRYDYAGCGARTGEQRAGALPTRALPANRWGLYHLHGNVSEWVADCWHETYRGAPTDQRPWSWVEQGECTRRVVRGGSWRFEPSYARSAARLWAEPAERAPDVGFRVVAEL